MRGTLGRWVLVAVLPLAACGGTAQRQPSPSSQASPTATAAACSTGGPASASWISPDKRTSVKPPIVSVVASGDTLTLTFDQGTPAYEITTQAGTTFASTTGQGGSVKLAGTAGVLIILRGFRGDMQNYTGPKDLTPESTMLVEAEEIGDFEGVVGWAAGLNERGCAMVTEGASSLTFRFVAT